MTKEQKILMTKRSERETIAASLRELMTRSELTDEEKNKKSELMARAVELDADIEFLKTQTPEIETRERETTPEQTELDQLFQRSSVVDFINEAEGMGLSGAALEYRQEVLPNMGQGYVPIDYIFGERLEERADVVTDIGSSETKQDSQQGGIMLPIPDGSVANYLNLQRPVVGVGTATYPKITDTPSADYRSPNVRMDADDIGLSFVSVDGVRLTARVTATVESFTQQPGLEPAITTLIRRAAVDKLDRTAVRGQAAVTNVSPKIPGILSGGGLTDPANPTEVATWDELLDVFSASRIDGRYSVDGSNVRLLANVDVYKYFAKSDMQIPTSGEILRNVWPSDRFRSSNHVPVASGNIGRAISFTSGHRAVVQPVWRAARLRVISDDVSGAASGLRSWTLYMVSNNVLVDTSPLAIHKFKIA